MRRPRMWLWRLLVGATVLAVLVAAAAFVSTTKKSDVAKDRARVATDLAAFERCLMGPPLAQNETMAARIRGIELEVALTDDSDGPALGEGGGSTTFELSPAKMHALRASHHPDGDPRDAGSDAAPPRDTIPLEKRWPTRCAPWAESLAHTLHTETLARDRSLDALRDALPTGDRMELPYALTPEEAADLAAAIDSAKLPAAIAPADNEPPPPALAPPLSSHDLSALGKGRLLIKTDPRDPATIVTTEVLATKTLRILVRDAGATLCTLDDADGYALARCKPLPDWVTVTADYPRFVNVEEGSPTSMILTKKSDRYQGARDVGLWMSTASGQKIVPMSNPPDTFGAFISKDGSYMIAGNYGALVRVGNADKVKTTSVSDPPGDSTAVNAVPSDVRAVVSAYGAVLYNDAPPNYSAFDPTRRMRMRIVQPSLSGKAIDLASAASDRLDLLAGCKTEQRTALVFGSDAQNATKETTVRVLIGGGSGEPRTFEAAVGDTEPHLTCLKDAAVITSVALDDPANVTVVETRCTGQGCESKRSAPIARGPGHEFDAMSLETGVLLLWKTKPELVLNRAKGMAFFRLAPLGELASALPRPLIENRRGGGQDVDHIHLLSRPDAAIIALDWGDHTPTTHAVVVDPTGTLRPVRVEESSW